jgi:hypothetical protein
MSASTQNLVFQRVQTVAGTAVAMSPQPYDNTAMVVVYNRGTNPMLIGIGAAGGPLAIANSTTVPAGGALSLPIGVKTQRPGPEFSGAYSLIMDSTGGAGDAQVTFLNQLVS